MKDYRQPDALNAAMCHCCCAPCCGTIATERQRLLSINISLPQGAQQQPAAPAVIRWDRQMDGHSTVS